MLGYNLLGYSSIMEIDRHQAQILVPVLTIDMTTTPPQRVVGGANVSPPVVSLQASPTAASDVQAGSQLQIPMTVVGVDPQLPGISISANIYPPATQISYVLLEPIIWTGTILQVGIVEIQYDLGGIGDTLIGEFSIGEGGTITKQVNKVPLLNILAHPPADVQSGVQILLPEPILMALQLPLAEIDSRRRKLRAQVILS